MDDGDSWPDFTLAEIKEMEGVYKEIGEAALSREFCNALATSFSFSASPVGRPTITWQQVQNWFRDKQKGSQAKVKSLSKALKLFINLSGESVSSNEPETSEKPKGCSISELKELAFEAKSSKDDAWYDVASFLTYRVTCAGDLEVRVRFSGFNNTEDEWVNVKTAVRERSIPLEPSECQKVEVGDLVLCYQRGSSSVL
ncbi:Protein SAWADEE HOMEODOMAIN like [Melia azedarach]|uniref:Protein SAWADEE HOMEODOMAIN like n=1 Tax=Melia azedarach TaxID=155640 RepID=A0ACC1Y4C1_MELAZ|nr:Protein SAWADEE HOMEODOMAIN like [Melia azedarach]